MNQSRFTCGHFDTGNGQCVICNVVPLVMPLVMPPHDTRYSDITAPYVPVKWDRVDFERLYQVRLAVRAGYYNEGEQS